MNNHNMKRVLAGIGTVAILSTTTLCSVRGNAYAKPIVFSDDSEGIVLGNSDLEMSSYNSNIVEVVDRIDNDNDNDAEATAVSAQTVVKSGTWGTCPWTIDSEGVLTVWPGTGADRIDPHGSPWMDDSMTTINESIKSVRVLAEEGRKVVVPSHSAQLFANLINATSFDLSGLDVSKATDLSGMFLGCNSVQIISFSGWDTSALENASGMFFGCRSLTSLDLSGWNTSHLNNIDGMFRACPALGSLNISQWDTSSITSMSMTFAGCSALTVLDVSRWNTSNVGTMMAVFADCSSLQALDLSGWDTSMVEDKALNDLWGMFRNCTSLERISVGKNYVIKSPRMFPDATAGSGWWSVAQRRWLPKDQILSSRSGVPDTYANCETSFTDVVGSTAHRDDISWLSDSGISKGWDNGDGTSSFRPYANVARADMAAFLFRLAKGWGLVEDGWRPAGTASFTDVTGATAHRDEILWLAESGISQGWDVAGGKKEFRPYANVARVDMAAFLHRLARLAGADGGSESVSFADVSAATPHAEDIAWLAESGVSRGWDVAGGKKEFRPYDSVARADMAAFLHRLDGLKG